MWSHRESMKGHNLQEADVTLNWITKSNAE
jgi:hypothetical protein